MADTTPSPRLTTHASTHLSAGLAQQCEDLRLALERERSVVAAMEACLAEREAALAMMREPLERRTDR